MAKTKDKKLNDRQLVFCYEYIATKFNALQAAKNAGYKGNENTIGTTSYQLMQNHAIKKKIEELTERYIHQVDVRASKVIKELEILAFRRMSDYVEINPETRKIRIRSQEEVGERDSAVNKLKVKQVDAVTGEEATKDSVVVSTEIEIQLCDKVKPLEILAKHLGIIKDTTSVEFPGGEFATTKEIDLSNFTTEELRLFLKLNKKAKEKNPILNDGESNL